MRGGGGGYTTYLRGLMNLGVCCLVLCVSTRPYVRIYDSMYSLQPSMREGASVRVLHLSLSLSFFSFPAGRVEREMKHPAPIAAVGGPFDQGRRESLIFFVVLLM